MAKVSFRSSDFAPDIRDVFDADINKLEADIPAKLGRRLDDLLIEIKDDGLDRDATIEQFIYHSSEVAARVAEECSALLDKRLVQYSTDRAANRDPQIGYVDAALTAQGRAELHARIVSVCEKVSMDAVMNLKRSLRAGTVNASPPAPSEHVEGIELLKRVLDKIGIESFLEEHKDSGVTHTALFDYKAGRIEGKVSPEKCALIKAAALATAAQLGL